MSIQELPEELFEAVIDSVRPDRNDLLALMSVDKRSNRHARDERRWKELFHDLKEQVVEEPGLSYYEQYAFQYLHPVWESRRSLLDVLDFMAETAFGTAMITGPADERPDHRELSRYLLGLRDGQDRPILLKTEAGFRSFFRDSFVVDVGRLSKAIVAIFRDVVPWSDSLAEFIEESVPKVLRRFEKDVFEEIGAENEDDNGIRVETSYPKTAGSRYVLRKDRRVRSFYIRETYFPDSFGVVAALAGADPRYDPRRRDD